MEILLKVLSLDERVLDGDLSACIGDAGGSIGRAADNALVLPDQSGYVSRYHAKIVIEAGQWYLEDCSSNGTVLRTVSEGGAFADDVLVHHDKVPLKPGSHLDIGGFEIEIQDIRPEVSGWQATDNSAPHLQAGSSQSAAGASSVPESSKSYDFESLIGISPVQQSFTPPAPTSTETEASEIPEQIDIDEFFKETATEKDSTGAVVPEAGAELKPQSDKAQPALMVGADLPQGNEFFLGLGLETERLPLNKQQALLECGKIFRVMLSGIIALMKGRSEIKKQMSAHLTGLQKEENNPLKFCNNVDELLPYLFGNPTPGFVSPLQAVEDCEDELLAHQMAMMAGMQAGIQMLVKKFDPASIESELGDSLFNRSSKCWDLYVKNYLQLTREVQNEFFGEEFRVAYERQLQKLKNNRL